MTPKTLILKYHTILKHVGIFEMIYVSLSHFTKKGKVICPRSEK